MSTPGEPSGALRVFDEVGGVRIEVFEDPDAVGRRVADLLAGVVARTPDAVLGLPTGSTPLPAYRELARRVASGALDLSGVEVFILDEYAGLPASDPRSYRATIRREVTDPCAIPGDRVHGPEGDAADPAAAAAAYEAAIEAAGGVDLQVVGIGRNGHVAFNEPGTPLDRRTHEVTLSDSTRADNARFFAGGEVPTRALTQGPATIAAARRLVLVATGAAKAEAVAAAVTGPVTAACPASIVQRHPAAIVVVDVDAARLLDDVDGHAVGHRRNHSGGDG